MECLIDSKNHCKKYSCKHITLINIDDFTFCFINIELVPNAVSDKNSVFFELLLITKSIDKLNSKYNETKNGKRRWNQRKMERKCLLGAC